MYSEEGSYSRSGIPSVISEFEHAFSQHIESFITRSNCYESGYSYQAVYREMENIDMQFKL